MGIVRKQSFKSSIISYIGAGIGYLNKGIIFTNLLDADQVGLANILVSIAVLYAQFSALGYANIILRFFPYFRQEKGPHHGFLAWALFIPFFGFLAITGLFLLFREDLISIYQEKSPLLTEYYLYLIPLGLATLYYTLFESYLRSLFKTVVPFLLKEVVQRLMVTLSVLLFALGWVDFPTFVMVYVGLYSSVTLFMLAYVIYLGQFRISFASTWRGRLLARPMMKFGGFSFLSNVSIMLILTIDSLMLASYLGMREVGIYTTAYFITSLVLIPWRAMAQITTPLVAEYWKSKSMGKMETLYKRTSLINMVMGSFLFLGLWVNRDFLFSLMKPEFAAGVFVLLFIGLNRVFNMITGLNSIILLTSRKYTWDMIFMVLLVALTIFTNIMFIPEYGVSGAAFATMLSTSIFNALRVGAVFFFYRMHPFSNKMLIVLLAAGLSYLAIWLLPGMSPMVGVLVKSILLSAIFGGIILVTRVSPDINNFIQAAIKRLSPKR